MSEIIITLKVVLGALLSFLPNSPFTLFINQMGKLEYLGYLNWFIPISTMIAIGQAWLVAVGIFYSYQLILRWAKAIE